MKKLLLLLFLIPNLVMGENHSNDYYRNILKKFQNRIETDSRLNPIRGYIYIQFDETKLKPDNLLNRKPSVSEIQAIDTYIMAIKEYFKDLDSSIYEIKGQIDGDDWVSILFKLKSGNITYLEHKKFTSKWKELSERDYQKLVNPKVLKLTCVTNSPSDVAGKEIVVKVDFTNNRIVASTGENQRNFIINEYQFQYTVSPNIVVSISRSTGGFTAEAPGTGILASGRCFEAKAKKF